MTVTIDPFSAVLGTRRGDAVANAERAEELAAARRRRAEPAIFATGQPRVLFLADDTSGSILERIVRQIPNPAQDGWTVMDHPAPTFEQANFDPFTGGNSPNSPNPKYNAYKMDELNFRSPVWKELLDDAKRKRES